MADRLTLVRSEDGRGWWVRRDATLYGTPVAVRQVWPVRNLSYGPGAVGLGDEDLDGAELWSLPSGPGPDYLLRYRAVDVWLPEGGRTRAIRRWDADVPPPPRCGVVTDPWKAMPGDAFWRHGTWHTELKRSRRAVPVAWDRLDWRETLSNGQQEEAEP